MPETLRRARYYGASPLCPSDVREHIRGILLLDVVPVLRSLHLGSLTRCLSDSSRTGLDLLTTLAWFFRNDLPRKSDLAQTFEHRDLTIIDISPNV